MKPAMILAGLALTACATSGPEGDDDLATDTDEVTLAGVQHIAAGGDFTCAIKHDKSITCWGADGSYAFPGNNPADGRLEPPAGKFTQLSISHRNGCALRANHTVACWGGNSQYGEANPPPAPGLYRSVSAGGYQTCGIMLDGEVNCWGGPGYPAPNYYAPLGAHFTQVSASSTQLVCSLATDGTLSCRDEAYDLYNENENPPGTFKQVETGPYWGCAIRTNGTLACWGRGYWPTPAGTFKQVSAGGTIDQWGTDKHACAISAADELVCWGDNTHGQATPPAGTFREVSAGVQHTCGVRTDGTAVCWGGGPGAIVPAGLSL